MKRKMRSFMMMVIVSGVMLSTGCAVEHTGYAGPYHKVVVYRHHPPKVYKVKTHKHRKVYYYPAGVYYPNNNP